MLNDLIFETVNNMFLNTDEHGQLILHGWPIGDETDAGGRFYKCIMRWEDEVDADDVVRYAQRLCTALVRLGEYYRDSGAAFGKRPDFGTVPDENTEEAEALHYAMECWEQILDGIEQETGSAEELEYKAQKAFCIPGLHEINYRNTFCRARRLCKVISLNAPDIIIAQECFRFTEAYTLSFMCDRLEATDLFYDTHITDDPFFFLDSDIEKAYNMIQNDCSLLPEPKVGYMLLANEMFHEHRLNIYRFGAELKAEIDKLLGTLPESCRRILRLRYGLDDGRRRRIDETAAEVHIPVCAVMGYESNAMRRLSVSSEAEHLYRFFR